MSSHPSLRCSIRLHVALLFGLVGCGQTAPRKVSVKHLLTSQWISSDGLTLTVGPASFAYKEGNQTELESFQILPDNQLLLGKDTVELYLNSKEELSIEPTSRSVRQAEDIRLLYATRFIRRPKKRQ